MEVKITDVIFSALLLTCNVDCITISNNDVRLYLDTSLQGIGLSLKLGTEEKLSGLIGEGLKFQVADDCDTAQSCLVFSNDDFGLNISKIDSGFTISWLSNGSDAKFQDCFDLKSNEISWFGGQEQYDAEWPIENMTFSNLAYRSSRLKNGAIAERYWLNSKGGYIFVDDKVPLFLEQNSLKKGQICYVAKNGDPYRQRAQVLLEYTIVAQYNAKYAHLHAVENFLGKPQGYPNERLIRSPIWTTWAKYKVNISDEIVVDFAKDIANHNFTGQLEIDDYWETCYGSLTFNEDFSNINSTVQTLKELNFTVTLWTHPFVNDNCKETTEFGRANNYFVKSLNGSDATTWWNSGPNEAHHIDFTNKDAKQWYVERLRLVQEKHGIDSFKFDAGENDWAPEVANLTGDVELAPNSLSEAYLRTVAGFGDLIEVRTAWRTQDLPIFVRMQDKDSRWGLDNGLHNLITTLLQININGYTLVLPDMIGGNGYGTDLPTAEILVRWTQANVFMPSMQFSYLPWDIPSEEFDSLAIIRNFVDLHENYADEILAAMDNCVTKGIPVNPPVWWVDPYNADAWKVNDEFMLGEKILVAPVIKMEARSRDVFLPTGKWLDGNSKEIYEGPITIKSYPAPIEILPYFIKQLN